MKYIILFLLFPFLLSSQTVTITHPDGIIVDNFGNKFSQDTTIRYIQSSDHVRVGTYTKDGKIIWGTSEPVYQGPSLYPDGWYDSIPPGTTPKDAATGITRVEFENSTPWVTADLNYPKYEVLKFKPKPVITFQAGKGIELTHTDTSIIISLAKSKDVEPSLNKYYTLDFPVKTPNVVMYHNNNDRSTTPMILAPSRIETGVLFSTPRDTLEIKSDNIVLDDSIPILLDRMEQLLCDVGGFCADLSSFKINLQWRDLFPFVTEKTNSCYHKYDSGEVEVDRINTNSRTFCVNRATKTCTKCGKEQYRFTLSLISD